MNGTSVLGMWVVLFTFFFHLTLRSLPRAVLSHQKCEEMLFQQEQKQTFLMISKLIRQPAGVPTVCWAWTCCFREELVHSGPIIIFSLLF